MRTSLSHSQNAEIRAFSDSSFPLYGQNRIRIFPVFGQILLFCPNTGKYGYDSIHIRENTNQRKSVF